MTRSHTEKRKSIKIALVGTRGVPAKYGGFETCVEELGKRLVQKGHKVTVYCRRGYYDCHGSSYLGMKRVCLPHVQTKSLDTMSHTFLSTWHALLQPFDIYMFFNSANSPFVLPLRLFGKKIVLNTDGLEWKRSKWGTVGRSYYKICEMLSCVLANRLVSDSPGIREYYEKALKTQTTQIAYGAYVRNRVAPKKIGSLGLEPYKYFLQITRFEPENNPLLTIKAFSSLNTNKRLVIVGGNPYPNDYTRKIEAAAGRNVLLPGFIYDQELLAELWSNCFAYVHGNEVGGTNPALLQAMGSGCFTIAMNVRFNKDVLADCGIYYEKDVASLAMAMTWALGHNQELNAFKRRAQLRIAESYLWDQIADEYEMLFLEVAGVKSHCY